MAWPFSGRRKSYVGTTITRVIQDELLSDLTTTAPIKSIFEGASLLSYIQDEIFNGLAVKVERGYRYGATGGYAHGLPNHRFINDSIGSNEMQSELETIHGGPVSLIYHRFASLHNIHVGMKILNENYNYDEVTNEIVALSTIYGSPVYMENMVGIISTQVTQFDDPTEITGDEYENSEPGSFSLYETPPNKRPTPWVNPQDSLDAPNWEEQDIPVSKIRLHFAYLNGGNVIRESLDLNLGGLDETKGYFHTKYYYDLANPAGAKIGYFTYEYGSGVYPIVEATVTRASVQSEFYPIVFFRHNRVDITAPAFRTLNDFITTEKLMKKMGMDYLSISDSINENPDVDKVEEAVLLYAIPVDDHKPLPLRYLFHFWEWVAINDVSAIVPEAQLDAEGKQIINRSITIEDREFRTQLNYGSISTTIKNGNYQPGPVFAATGDCSSDITSTLEEYEVYFEQENSDNEILSYTQIKEKRVYSYHFYKQISATQYQEIRVNGLSQIYRVAGQDVYINTDDEDGRLLIPLNYNIVKQEFNLIERDRLYGCAMHLVFNSRVTKKIPWYATGAFKAIMAVVAVVVTYFTAGTAGPAIKATYAAYAATYGAAAGALLLALEYVAVSYAINLGMRFVANEFGAEAALILGTIGLIVGSYGALASSTWAPNLLTYSSGLIEASASQFQIDTNEYLLEQGEFKTFSEEKFDALEEINKQFDTSSIIDPLALVGRVPRLVMGESPSSFYARTTGSNNIGVLGYEHIEHYVDMSLRLPSFEDTIRGFNHE